MEIPLRESPLGVKLRGLGRSDEGLLIARDLTFLLSLQTGPGVALQLTESVRRAGLERLSPMFPFSGWARLGYKQAAAVLTFGYLEQNGSKGKW